MTQVMIDKAKPGLERERARRLMRESEELCKEALELHRKFKGLKDQMRRSRASIRSVSEYLKCPDRRSP